MKHSFQSGFGVALIITVIALVALGGGAYYMSQPSDTRVEPMQHNVSDSEMATIKAEMEDGSRETIIPEEVVSSDNVPAMEADTKEMITDQSDPESMMNLKPGTFEDYSPEKLALADAGTVVLFFHANWCPSCRALEADIKANLSDIPTNVHLLKVDYDRATELKKKYGVVRQHTLVQVNAQGNMIKTLSGLVNTLDQVVSQI